MSARRLDVLGRTSCILCRRLLRSPFSMRDHRREKHPETLAAPRRKLRADLDGPDGRKYCVNRHPPKVVFETIDDAWIGAFLVFAERGWILTPYRCSDVEIEITLSRFVDEPIYMGARYNPYPIKRRCTTYSKRVRGCGRWHLTKTVGALLP